MSDGIEKRADMAAHQTTGKGGEGIITEKEVRISRSIHLRIGR